MHHLIMKSAIVCAAVLFGAEAFAQGGPPQYGTPISLEQAQKAINAAAAEAKKNNWFLAITVVGPSGHLIAFNAMDNTQYASIAISQHKARFAATYRRPTKVFQDQLTGDKPNLVIMTLDDMIASDGGYPIIADSKLIGAIGCSGATGAQDGQACMAGVNALK
jgi:uncharacterized protein GlcG (DUF336 family)